MLSRKPLAIGGYLLAPDTDAPDGITFAEAAAADGGLPLLAGYAIRVAPLLGDGPWNGVLALEADDASLLGTRVVITAAVPALYPLLALMTDAIHVADRTGAGLPYIELTHLVRTSPSLLLSKMGLAGANAEDPVPSAPRPSGPPDP